MEQLPISVSWVKCSTWNNSSRIPQLSRCSTWNSHPLTNLVDLNLHGNDFSDISAQEGLQNLQILVLLENTVSDISGLEGLTNLEYPDVQENYRITDISSLANMTELTWLGFHYN